MTFRHTITLWCSRWRELRNYFALFQMKTKLVTQIFSSTIRSQKFYFLVTMIFHFTLKFFELFKCFRLMFHQVDILISAQIICEDQKIMIPVASLNIHRTTYISMYDFQQISLLASLFRRTESQSSCPRGMVRKHQLIHNQVIPKAYQHGVSSCALHQYDLNSSATNNLHYHY